MGTLYIDRKGLHVKLDGNALAFYANGEREGMVPVNPLKRVVIVGNITLEASVLHRLSDEGISVIFLSGRRLSFHGVLHGRLHNNGLLRVKQYEKSTEKTTGKGIPVFAAEVSTELVRRKVAAQATLLKDALDGRPDLRFALTTALATLEKIGVTLYDLALSNMKLETLNFELPEARLDTLRGLEGAASAAYFSAYTTLFPDSLHFRKRNRRPPEDPVNAVLSLCYTMLHYEMVREIEVIGLDPTIGYYHQFEYGRESLASDLIEPFRPDVDRFVWALFRDREFAERDFAFNGERPGCYLKKGSRKRFYPLYEVWARDMRSRLTDEVRNIARRIIDGEDPLPE